MMTAPAHIKEIGHHSVRNFSRIVFSRGNSGDWWWVFGMPIISEWKSPYQPNALDDFSAASSKAPFGLAAS